MRRAQDRERTNGPGGPGACLLWFRRDLRLSDNPALNAALARGGPIVPVYIESSADDESRAPGRASVMRLRRSLAALDADLRRRGSRLILRDGPAAPALARLLEETGARAVYWSRIHEPAALREEERVRRALTDASREARDFPGNLLFAPDDLRTKAGAPFRVFTPYYREALRRLDLDPVVLLPPRRPLPAPSRWPRARVAERPGSRRDAEHARACDEAGERAAQQRLAAFVDEHVLEYERLHDRPDLDATSRLSAHLHFGEISVQQVWQAIATRARRSPGADAFLRQLIWREFAHHVLASFPALPDRPLHAPFGRLPWTRPGARFDAWRAGRTGYPLVDAAMRQLRETGWVHNRARLVAGSFLVKDLLIRWQAGERWFWEMLADGDVANNAFNWQWVAGCGADPAPFFRIFNPMLQGRKFDPRGEYVRRYVPELARLSERHIHEPWDAPADVLRTAGIRLGRDYPRPIVDHAQARDRALMAFDVIKSRS